MALAVSHIEIYIFCWAMETVSSKYRLGNIQPRPCQKWEGARDRCNQGVKCTIMPR